MAGGCPQRSRRRTVRARAIGGPRARPRRGVAARTSLGRGRRRRVRLRAPRLELHFVARPLRLVPALAKRRRQVTVLLRSLPLLRRFQRLELAVDQPPAWVVDPLAQPVHDVPVEAGGDALAQRVVPPQKLVLGIGLNLNLEDEADRHQMPPSTLIVMPDTNSERSLARKSATPATSSEFPRRLSAARPA